MENITKREIVFDILEFYRSNVKDNDSIDYRQISYWVDTLRVTLIKRHIDKYSTHPVDESLVQTISPVTMELVDSSVYTGLPTGRYYARTNISIPVTIEKNGGIPLFTRIGPADKLTERFQIVNSDWGLLYGNGKFNKNAIATFVLGDRIVITSKNKQSIFGIKYLDIRGVFQNPTKAALITNPLYNDDNSYPINLGMIDEIKNIILNREFRATGKVPVDPNPVNPEQVSKQE